MTNIRQSIQFSRYMKNLGWKTEKIGDNFIYLRRFPILGNFAKIPYPKLPINILKILEFKKSWKIFRLKISPLVLNTDKNYNLYRKQFLNAGFKIDISPFNPTTNYIVDLNKKEDDIFRDFIEAKRRSVRRAIKNGLFVKETTDLESFIKIRKKQYSPLGFLVKNDMVKLWRNLYPNNATLLLAYTGKNVPVAGILLLFYGNTAYYWYASALPIGKKLFAPTLLVWEALKLSKKRGCKIFDFEGIYDERFPKASESWKGFTKFKEGFGVKKIVYMENFTL